MALAFSPCGATVGGLKGITQSPSGAAQGTANMDAARRRTARSIFERRRRGGQAIVYSRTHSNLVFRSFKLLNGRTRACCNIPTTIPG